MKRLLTTTALVAMTAMPVAAEQHANNANSEMEVSIGAQEMRVSNLMNATVYMPAEGASEDLSGMDMSEVPDDWTEIGSVSDVFVDDQGNVSTVVLSASDAANASADTVGLSMDNVTVKQGGQEGQIFVVYTGDKVTLEEAEEFDQAQAESEGQQSVSQQQSQMADNSQSDQSNTGGATGQSAQMNGDDSQQSMQSTQMESNGLTIRAADLTGHPVYIPGEGSTGDELPQELSAVEDDWERIGEIGGVVLSREGQIKSVTMDVGGFLGIDEKEVETTMEELRFVRDSDSDADNEWFVVYTGDRSALEEKDSYDQAASQDAGEQYMTQEDMAQTDGQSGQQMAQSDDGAMQADQSAEGMTNTETGGEEMIAAEELDGAPVYDANGDEVGNISRLLMNDAGDVTEVIVDVGGFLGIGEKPVALAYDQLSIDKEVDTAFGDVRVNLSQTRDELEQMDRWSE